MRYCIITVVILLLSSCSNRVTHDIKPETADTSIGPLPPPPGIKVVSATFPLYLSKIDFANASYQKVPDNVGGHIVRMVFGESVTMDDTYFNTVEIVDGMRTYYLVLEKQMPGGYLNGIVLCMDRRTGVFYRGSAELKLFALYDVDGKQLKPSNLKEQFKINTPEIEAADSVGDIRLTRLFHNGTYNAIERQVLRFSPEKVDTISMEMVPL